MEYYALLVKGKEKVKVDLKTEFLNDSTVFTLPAEAVDGEYEYIDFLPDFFTAYDKDEGYFIISNTGWCRLVHFKENGADGHYDSGNFGARILGFLKNGIATVGFVTGMRDEFRLCCGRKNGSYYYFPRFTLEGRKPYEDIKIVLHTLPRLESDYSGMARWYREFGIQNGYFTTLTEKIKGRPQIKYATESIYVRIRMAWKPAPPTVLEQTRETEPPMHVACTFEMVEDLIDEMKSAGVDKAEICLVGWNVKGHDGRWPEMFPVEPELGGEKGLKHLLDKAEKTGYTISLHTNFTDAYTIAEDFSPDYIIKNPDGSLQYDGNGWSGGRMYHVSLPLKEKDYIKELKRIKEIGNFGMHYSDVISLAAPRRSYDPIHPFSPKDFRVSCDNVFSVMQQLFGGSASEGGSDVYFKNLDYALYGQFSPDRYYTGEEWMDENIPLWAMIFHGTIIYNATTSTINYSLKSPQEKLRLWEYGGRPCAYCFVNFVTNNAIWGKADLSWNKGEKPTAVAKAIAEMYEEYKTNLLPLQTVFIKRHDFLPDGSSQITYENGTKIITNFNTDTFEIKHLPE